MALVQINFESKYLRCNTDVSIILPDKPRRADPEEFYAREVRYPVFWLLHGTFGDHTDWYRHTNIELYACEKDCIVVMPSAINTDYENWPGFGTGYYQYDFLLKELMPLVYHWFPASDRREDNFIGGLSMGGRGALMIALENPDRFAAVAALSAVPRDYRAQRAWMEEALSLDRARLAAEAGNYAGPFDPAFRAMRMANEIENNGGTVEDYLRKYDVAAYIEKARRTPNFPALFCACGTDDPIYGEYAAFKRQLQAAGIPATFAEESGYRHEWRFWDRYVEKALEFFGLAGETGGKEYLGGD